MTSRNPVRIALGLVAVLVVGVLIWGGVAGSRPVPPPVSVTFLGPSPGAIYRNPYGRFEVTNHTPREVTFVVTAEAPADPYLSASQGLDSRYGIYRVPASETIEVRILVAWRPGVPFRAVVDCQKPAGLLVRSWNRAADMLPPLRGLWAPSGIVTHTVHGAWCVLPEESGSVPAIR